MSLVLRWGLNSKYSCRPSIVNRDVQFVSRCCHPWPRSGWHFISNRNRSTYFFYTVASHFASFPSFPSFLVNPLFVLFFEKNSLFLTKTAAQSWQNILRSPKLSKYRFLSVRVFIISFRSIMPSRILSDADSARSILWVFEFWRNLHRNPTAEFGLWVRI